MLDHLGQRCHCFAQHFENRRRAQQRVVENTVQKVFDRPGKLAEIARSNHAPAALQRVEGAAHCDERLAIEGVLIPRGETALDLCKLFVRFFDEKFDQLGVRTLREGRDNCGARRG